MLCCDNAAGIDATRLRAGPAKRSQHPADLLAHVAGRLPGPAVGPAVPSPASVFFDFRRPFKLREPATYGLPSRRTRLLANEEVA